MTEGPCLVVDWFDNKQPAVSKRSIYYPSPLATTVVGEDYVLKWMRRYGCTIRSLTWAWGIYPVKVPKSRIKVA